MIAGSSLEETNIWVKKNLKCQRADLLDTNIIEIDERHYLNMISSKKSLVTLKSLVKVPECNMDISETFLHHCNIYICCSSIWMRRSTCKMQKIEGTIDIPE